MEKKSVKISNRSRLGWGWTCACEQVKGNLRVCKVEKPDYVGTYNQILDKIHNDRSFQSTRQSGAYFRTAWFVWNSKKKVFERVPEDEFDVLVLSMDSIVNVIGEINVEVKEQKNG